MKFVGKLVKQTAQLEYKRSLKKDLSFNLQQDTLLKLLKFSRRTLLGKTYRFTKIIASKDLITEFQKQVPIQNYDEFYITWLQHTIAGKKNIIWPGKINYFALSSGTTGAPSKQIPITKQMIKSFQKTSLKQIVTLCQFNLPTEFFQKQVLVVGGSSKLNKIEKRYEGDLSGILKKHTKKIATPFAKPSKRISDIKDWNKKLEKIVEEAPKWDIGILVGVPAWCQLLLEKIIERYQLKNIHDIWPNLTLYVHGGVSFEPYRKSFDSLVARPLTCIETYLASEGFIAYQDEQDNRSMKLVTNNGLFFEFVPFNEENFNGDGELVRKPKTFLIDEVKVDEEYALLLSTCAGAWRYLIGDVVKFTNVEKAEIIISGRTKHYLSLCGEHLSVDNMNKAIEMVSDELDIRINEFTVAGIKHGSMFAHKWFIGTDDKVNAVELKFLIDTRLKMLNDDYRVERTSALKDIVVVVLSHQVFLNWMESKGKIGNQNKFPRVMKNSQLEQWEEFVNQLLQQSN